MVYSYCNFGVILHHDRILRTLHYQGAYVMHLSGIFSEEYSKKTAEYMERLRNMDNNKEHIERTKHLIEVMQAYVDGHPVESMTEYSAWQINPNPLWDFSLANYRIAKTPDTINWDHVAPEFKYMARDEDGTVFLYEVKPERLRGYWRNGYKALAISHSSYRRGTCDWKDSLVIRPGCE